MKHFSFGEIFSGEYKLRPKAKIIFIKRTFDQHRNITVFYKIERLFSTNQRDYFSKLTLVTSCHMFSSHIQLVISLV